MMDKNRTVYLAVLISIVLLLSFLVADYYGQSQQGEIVPATGFTATDHLNRTFTLNDSAGKVTILHITQLESPLCIECEKHMREQINELATLEESNADVNIITLNIRKNSYSEDGWKLAQDWYDINITWHWVEEYEPFAIARHYQKYWEVEGSFANPSIILIDPELNIVGVYHAYCIGSGEMDGVQTAESLEADAESIISGDWGEFRGQMAEDITLAGMFFLGIITAISPCSIALLVVMISYIGSQGESGEEGMHAGRKKGLMMGTAFTLGMTLMFFLIGMLVAYIGLFIEMSAAFYLLAGAILVLLGINAVRPLNWGMLARIIPVKKKVGNGDKSRKDRWLDMMSRKSGVLGAFLLGLLFTVAWAPCAISLVFPVIVLMLARDFSLLAGAVMLGIFGLGHGIVIIPIAAATADVKARIGNRLVAAGRWIQPGFGIVIILLGIIFAMRFWGWNLW